MSDSMMRAVSNTLREFAALAEESSAVMSQTARREIDRIARQRDVLAEAVQLLSRGEFLGTTPKWVIAAIGRDLDRMVKLHDESRKLPDIEDLEPVISKVDE